MAFYTPRLDRHAVCVMLALRPGP